MAINIKTIINEHIDTIKKLSNKDNSIEEISALCLKTIENGNTILLCGNGGSAADAIHIAAELVGKFESNRESFPAIALSSNISNITSIGNDFGFEHIFSRQIEGVGNKGDLLIAISTSGNSQNIIQAVEKANIKKMKVIILTGKDGGKLSDMNYDLILKVDSYNTARIQEAHILIGHIICNYIEKNI